MPVSLEPKRSFRSKTYRRRNQITFISCLIFITLLLAIGILLNPISLNCFLGGL